MSSPDKRCCGSGVCIITDAGECWCGQVWDGEKMAAPKLTLRAASNGVHEQEQEKDKLKPDASFLVSDRSKDVI
jgi:hypothetical protein